MLPNGRFVEPELVVSHFHLKEGDVVADFGAGSGFFLKAVSTRVGENGLVYACEIQKPLVEKIADTARILGLYNVRPIWCDLEEAGGIKIPTGTLDVGILINTLFSIEDQATAVKEMSRTLRSGANFFVVDWTESFAGIGPTPNHVITAAAATALFEANGFVLERDYPTGDHHYGLAFRKI